MPFFFSLKMTAEEPCSVLPEEEVFIYSRFGLKSWFMIMFDRIALHLMVYLMKTNYSMTNLFLQSFTGTSLPLPIHLK